MTDYNRYSKQANQWIWLIGSLLMLVIFVMSVTKFGILAGFVFLVLPFIVTFVIVTYKKPILLLYLLFIFSFCLTLIDRYFVKGMFPVGTLIDLLIIYTYAIYFLSSFSGGVDFKKAADAPLVALGLWLFYCVLELFNPEAPPAFSVWFIGVRPSFYMILGIPLFCMMLNVKTTKRFIYLWGICSMILTIKGFIQLKIGLDVTERILMSGPFRYTHLLWGQLRVFSFCSDAGQFGTIQAFTGICGAIMFLGATSNKERLFLLAMSLTGIYGMFISGTRGSLFIVLMGALVYLCLIKKIKLLTIGAICFGIFFFFMRYSDAGSGVYAIRRMRTAFNTEKDASFNARYSKELQVKEYVSTRPFGCGFGSMDRSVAGAKLPGLGTDSGYVLMLGQQGIIGLCLYLGILAYFMMRGAFLALFRLKNPWLRNVVIASVGGIGGIAVANYANPVIMQHPTCLVFFFCVATIFVSPRLDKELALDSAKNE